MVEQTSREEDASVLEKFELATQDISTYRNCAGFVAYMLNIQEKETLISPNFLANNLISVGEKEFDNENSIAEKEYLELAKKSKAVSILIEKIHNPNSKTLKDIVNNTRTGLIHIHFALIDPNNPYMIYERPDIEKKPRHTKWEHLFNDLEEFNDFKKKMVFFNKD